VTLHFTKQLEEKTLPSSKFFSKTEELPLAINSTGKTPHHLLTGDNANGWEQLVAAEADLRDTLSSASFTMPADWVVEDVVQS